MRRLALAVAVLLSGCSTTYMQNPKVWVGHAPGGGINGEPGTVPLGLLEAMLSSPECPISTIPDLPTFATAIWPSVNQSLKEKASVTVLAIEGNAACTLWVNKTERSVYVNAKAKTTPYKVDKLPANVFDDPNAPVDAATAKAAMGLAGAIPPAAPPAKK